jgi:hypothetical protein
MVSAQKWKPLFNHFKSSAKLSNFQLLVGASTTDSSAVVLRSLRGWREKFFIFNQQEKTRELDELIGEFQKLNYEEWAILQVILLLSDRPLDTKPTTMPPPLKEAVIEKGLAYIPANNLYCIEEEGDLSDLSDWDEIYDEEEEEKGADLDITAQVKESWGVAYQPLPTQGQTQLPEQYWRKAYSTVTCIEGDFSYITRIVTEADLTREVIFLLLGLDSIVFTFDSGVFTYRPNVLSLSHLSNSALASLMKQFASLSNTIQKVVLFSNQASLSKNNLILKAFGSGLQDEWYLLHKELVVLERYYQKLEYSQDGPRSASLLWLLREVKTLSRPFQALAPFIEKFSTHAASKEMTGFILSQVYTQLLDYQERELESEKNAFFRLFLSVLDPYLDLLGKAFSTDIQTDYYQELFLIR